MKKSLLGLAVVLGLSACTTPRGAGVPLERWSNFEDATISNDSLGENQSLAVFYRKKDINGPAVNIYINGHYQASLLPDAFTPMAVCADKHLFSASFSTSHGFGNRTDGVKYTLPVGEIAYIKLQQNMNGEVSFVRVPKEIAEQEMAQMPKESQTLSRVPKAHDCQPPVVISTIAVDSSALFAFDTYHYKDILPAGRQRLEAFLQKAQHLNMSHIEVGGHTDAQGKASYNLALSQKRADTVKEALEKSGISVPIKAVGFGDKELIVRDCAHLKGAAQVQCNQPNRRVEITVYGTK